MIKKEDLYLHVTAITCSIIALSSIIYYYVTYTSIYAIVDVIYGCISLYLLNNYDQKPIKSQDLLAYSVLFGIISPLYPFYLGLQKIYNFWINLEK